MLLYQLFALFCFNVDDKYNALNINVFFSTRIMCLGFLTSVYSAFLQLLHHSALDQVCVYSFVLICISKHRYSCTGSQVYISPFGRDHEEKKVVHSQATEHFESASTHTQTSTRLHKFYCEILDLSNTFTSGHKMFKKSKVLQISLWGTILELLGTTIRYIRNF